MPHQCTKCHAIYQEGSTVILNGCPKCGNNKFEYIKERKDKVDIDNIIQETPATKKRRKMTPESVESVRIVSSGEYELNLDSLLKRDDIVLGLKNEGEYIVPLTTIFDRHKKKKIIEKKK
ncbi:MAG: hypothetical protein EF812_02725 [Methanosarcinales archaeon]|nr:MAG: hypothetical protein EF812_02725 [Methanosarcinales archaeon]